eukprot:TRINITY_DN17995_c0_g1_i1.p1 TRINITY_DN17995_c0_g1~~TRINITY_DN17995_c0_g1_i1.p1  ORF type:complete len:120 (+),score=8.73 TRINITY_DN17995_c0_g1_i1:3-362(+)
MNKTAITILRLFYGVGFITLFSLIIWGLATENISTTFKLIASTNWGVVTLVDLYLGFISFAIIIWLFENNKLIASILIFSTFFLGSLIPSIWLTFKLGMIVDKLKNANDLSSHSNIIEN